MTSDSGLVVCALIKIDGKTEINYRVYEGGLAEFSIDGGGFGPLTIGPGPRDLVDHAREALRATLSAALSAVTRNDEGCARE